MSSTLSLDLIRTDGGTQARAGRDAQAVADYADAYRTGKELPAVVVFHDGSEYWLADGFHRVETAAQAEQTDVLADIRQGTQRDAVLYACGANQGHGLRRTNEDKRRAVERMLRDAEWAKWSDRRIADHIGVHNDTVSAYRKRLSDSDSGVSTTERVGRDGRTTDTSGIGKTPRERPARTTPPAAPETPRQEVTTPQEQPRPTPVPAAPAPEPDPEPCVIVQPAAARIQPPEPVPQPPTPAAPPSYAEMLVLLVSGANEQALKSAEKQLQEAVRNADATTKNRLALGIMNLITCLGKVGKPLAMGKGA